MSAAATSRKRQRLFGNNAWLSVLGGLALALAMSGEAGAYWTATGTGSGSGPVGTLGAPTISSATNGAATATLTWSAVSPLGSGSVTYYVTRNGGNPAGDCPTSALPASVLTCTDGGLSPGTYSYTVTAVWHTWTATSPPAQVTVIGPPVNTVLPVISGTATQGQVLSTTDGTWTNSPTGLTYQWRRCDSTGNNCSNISGATSSAYTLVYADAGSTIRVVVTATNPYGTGAATSLRYPSSGTVQGLAPVNTALPVISGIATQGQVISTGNGSWDNSPTGYSYQWQRCDSAGNNCSNLPGATSGSYTLVYADAGSTMRVVVTATNPYGSTAATSAQYPASGTVQGLAPVNTTVPVISGTATQGQLLSTTNGSWDNLPTGYTGYGYQWRRCSSAGSTCSDISGATSSTYTLVSADAGSTMRVVVTATNPYGSGAATSDKYPSSGTVRGLPPANTALPAIDGTAVQGETLTASTGIWDNSPTGYGYQWQRCDSAGNTCSNISGATSGAYVLKSGDVGSTIRVVVTAINPYGSAAATSAAFGTVQAAVPVDVDPPIISGAAEAGQTLTADPGTWTNSPTGYGYQWQRCDSAGNNCSNISGATAIAYTLVDADVGSTIRVVVTATNPNGSAVATSDQTAVVVPAGTLTPVNLTLPTIPGQVKVGSTVTASTGTWTNFPSSYTYQWRLCGSNGSNCVDILGATSSTYLVLSGDAGHSLRVIVTATNTNGSTSATSGRKKVH